MAFFCSILLFQKFQETYACVLVRERYNKIRRRILSLYIDVGDFLMSTGYQNCMDSCRFSAEAPTWSTDEEPSNQEKEAENLVKEGITGKVPPLMLPDVTSEFRFFKELKIELLHELRSFIIEGLKNQLLTEKKLEAKALLEEFFYEFLNKLDSLKLSELKEPELKESEKGFIQIKPSENINQQNSIRLKPLSFEDFALNEKRGYAAKYTEFAIKQNITKTKIKDLDKITIELNEEPWKSAKKDK